jgi:hypothetical protein
MQIVCHTRVLLVIQSWGKDGSNCDECAHQLGVTMNAGVVYCQYRALHIYIANTLVNNICSHARKGGDKVRMRKYDATQKCDDLCDFFGCFARSHGLPHPRPPRLTEDKVRTTSLRHFLMRLTGAHCGGSRFRLGMMYDKPLGAHAASYSAHLPTSNIPRRVHYVYRSWLS